MGTRTSMADVIELAPGEVHTILLKIDGSVWSSGLNNEGQLGIDSKKSVSTSFMQALPCCAKAAAAGLSHSLVVMEDGTVWSTGKNSKGQLGDGSTNPRNNFFPIKNIFFSKKIIRGGAKAVAAGGDHSMVLTHDGRLWASGWNQYGQLGDGSTSNRKVFFRVVSGGVKDVATGDIHTVMLHEDGSLWATGGNAYGQLGTGSVITGRNTFIKVIPSGVEAVAAGGYHTMVLKQDDSVWVVGWNKYGQLGIGSRTDQVIYRKVIPNGAKSIGAGSRHSLLVMQDGSVWATGYNRYGQLGDFSTTNSNRFEEVISSGAQSVAGGGYHSMLIMKDGSTWAAGSNRYAQFGDGSRTSERTFVRVAQVGDGFGGLSLGAGHSLMLNQDTSVWATGFNLHGQLGDGSRRNFMTDFMQVIDSGAKAVAAGGAHSMVLKQDGSVWATGRNRLGQLGDGSFSDRQGFVMVISSGAQSIGTGAKHSLMVKDGGVWVTGYNAQGQLGDGSTSNSNEFMKVISGGAKAVAGGAYHSMVLLQDGSVWSTGMNDSGQLGDGSTTSKNDFVGITDSATAIAAGGFHSLVLKADGSVWVTGDNRFGQLGDDSTDFKDLIQTVNGDFMRMPTGGAEAIAAGMAHSIVLGQDGSVWATGRNNRGQLGDGTTLSKSFFIQVVFSGAQAVAAGGWHTMVMKQHDIVWATGANEYGQLGDGSRIPKKTFTHVAEEIDDDTDSIIGGEFAALTGIAAPSIAIPIPTMVIPICSECDTIKKSGSISCCARGGAWFENCGDTGDINFDHTWVEGIQTCQRAPAMSLSPVSTKSCSKCGTMEKSGKLSCCGRGGAWFNKCEDAEDANSDYTWEEGIEACESWFRRVCFVPCAVTSEAATAVGTSNPAAPSPTTITTVSTAPMVPVTTVEAPTTATTSAVTSKGCPKCGTTKKSGKLSCCARGGAWFGQCGDAGDTNFDHTWVEGIQACKRAPTSASAVSSEGCPTCVATKQSGKLSCCARGGAWFNKCGDAGDANFDHTWLEGIQACEKAPATTNVCPKCGTTNKSGKLSCCARGGAWFNQCGDAGDANFDHTWLEGIQACEKASTTTNTCPKCGKTNKSGKLSCCARGGAWFNKCGDAGDANFDHTWLEGIQACEGFVSSFLQQSPAQALIRHKRAIDQPLNTNLSPNATHPQNNIVNNIYPGGSVSYVRTTNSEDGVELSKIVVCASLLFINLPIHM